MPLPKPLLQLHRALEAAGNGFAPFLLLFIRLYWGWQYHVTGMGKLRHLDRITQYFGGTLHLPAPHATAVFVAVTETFGGLLLLLGLGTRFLAPIFIAEMFVAFLTAQREALFSVFSDYDKFTSADPFLFLAAFLVLFAFGPGLFSLDALIFRRRSPSSPPGDHGRSAGPAGR